MIGTRCSSQPLHARDEIVQIVRSFAWLNPHAAFTLRWDGKLLVEAQATDPTWLKWRPSDPAPAAWYDPESFNRLIAACVAHDQDHGRDRTVREFIAEFRGFARSDTQKRLLDDVAAARVSLREFFKKPKQVAKLLAHMQSITKPVPAKDLGLLGKDHFIARFSEMGVGPDTFQYRRALCDVDGVPYAIEAAFGYCPDNSTHRQIVGVNWSPSLISPFRDLGPYDSLDALLADQRAGRDDEPIVLALHLASPCTAYTDKAKSALVLPDAVVFELAEAVKSVTKSWARQRKAEERDASARDRRLERLSRSHKETIISRSIQLCAGMRRSARS
jgi:DNA topoisomerase VI subunit B